MPVGDRLGWWSPDPRGEPLMNVRAVHFLVTSLGPFLGKSGTPVGADLCDGSGTFTQGEIYFRGNFVPSCHALRDPWAGCTPKGTPRKP